MPNKLAEENSPYLLQHANNPVEWYGWGEEAFQLAAELDRPIFLSIGYSTCHWCHVMAHESFENKEIAELMNDHFVNIKVDREERPDIDKFYMSVAQTLTGSGGWPLTIIMSPDKNPFFAATYIPPETRHNRLGMLDLIPQISKIWQEDRSRIDKSIVEIMDFLKQQTAFKMPIQIREDNFSKAFQQFTRNYDKENGGFGQKPKFPSAHNLMFLLRYYKNFKEPEALKMVEKTLEKISSSGIFDQIGFGFHRYATDSQWKIPHFEKMLYDQAMLGITYAEAYQLTAKRSYRDMAEKIVTYVLRDMRSKEGGFFSAEDADSEGEEGKFYVFSISDLEAILSDEERNFVINKFSFKQKGNFQEEATGRLTGNNIFHFTEELAPSEQEFWESIRVKLYNYRANRISPFKDDKILTDWNGLMIATLAKMGRILKQQEYIEAAERALNFINQHLFIDNQLQHRWRNGLGSVTGNLDDHAFLIWGLLGLFEATLNSSYLMQAIKLTDIVISQFRDRNKGAYYFTRETNSEFSLRSRELYDGAYPSGNSVMFYNLNKLERYTADKKYTSEIKGFLKGFSVEIHKAPMLYTFFLQGLNNYFYPGFDVVYTAVSRKEFSAFKDLYNEQFLPNSLQLYADKNDKNLMAKLPWLENYQTEPGKVKVFVCHNRQCEAPVTELEDFAKLIKPKK